MSRASLKLDLVIEHRALREVTFFESGSPIEVAPKKGGQEHKQGGWRRDHHEESGFVVKKTKSVKKCILCTHVSGNIFLSFADFDAVFRKEIRNEM